MSAEAHPGALFFECLFLNAFSDALFEPWMSYWRLGLYFGSLWEHFSYLGSFLKIALPCRQELKNQGPGVTEIAQKSNNKCIWLWDCFGKQVFKEIIQFWYKSCFKRNSTLEPRSDLGGT